MEFHEKGVSNEEITQLLNITQKEVESNLI